MYCLYTIQAPERDRLQQTLRAAGIGSAVHYPVPIHLLPAYADPRYQAGDFPVAERCCESVLSLPVYPHLEKSQVEQVCEAIRSWKA